jgi:hypothetical protein
VYTMSVSSRGPLIYLHRRAGPRSRGSFLGQVGDKGSPGRAPGPPLSRAATPHSSPPLNVRRRPQIAPAVAIDRRREVGGPGGAGRRVACSRRAARASTRGTTSRMSMRSSSGPESFGWEACPAVRLAIAATDRIAVEPARARVRGRDEREPRRELHGPGRSCHHDPSVPQRLPQAFDRRRAGTRSAHPGTATARYRNAKTTATSAITPTPTPTMRIAASMKVQMLGS